MVMTQAGWRDALARCVLGALVLASTACASGPGQSQEGAGAVQLPAGQTNATPASPERPAGTTPAAAAPAGPPAARPTQAPETRGSVQRKELKGNATIPQIDAMEDRFLIIDHDVPSKYAVDWYRIEFDSTDVLSEQPLRLVAQVFTPRSAEAATFPLYVFGPGTTGLVDDCAPSKEQASDRDWGDFHSHLLTYATQGYVAVMPDFEGFNDGPRLHHYYVGEQQARVMLDAARAALRFFDDSAPARPAAPIAQQGQAAQNGQGGPPAKDNPVFFAGYSHGGYVALAARDFAPRYAPELKVRGAIGYGPRSDPTTLFKEMPSLAPYLLWSYADFYGKDKVPFDRILQQRWLSTLERDVTGKCIDEVPTYYGPDPAQVFTPEFLGALNNNTLGQQFPALKQLLDRNKAGLGNTGVPVLVLQGTEDTVVYPATMRAYMRELCATGARGAYVSYTGIEHTQTRQVSYEDTLIWLSAVLQGQAPRSTC